MDHTTGSASGVEDADRSVPLWPVSSLLKAIADSLEARFNPVAVQGEISGFSRAASGHCYFSLKDDNGQIRCAMFRRASTLLDFSPRDGLRVELRGRLGVYEARGELQLIVESMRQAGQGTLFEQFLKLKAKLEAEGLFEPTRKRALPVMPRGIGVVTSLNAAALHDVVTALGRRVPHIPVVVAPALVQGSSAPGEIMRALLNLYLLTQYGRGLEADFSPKIGKYASPDMFLHGMAPDVTLDVILLVRGGGSIDDLWAFNDERLARVIAQSPVPVIAGVGHETDFTIADFVADLRAPTPTAAAELAAQPRAAWLAAADAIEGRLQDAVLRRIDIQHQRLDGAAARLGRPSALAARQRLRLASLAQRLKFYSLQFLKQGKQDTRGLKAQMPVNLQRGLARQQDRLTRASLRLELLDPTLVLQRGYAWLAGLDGQTIGSIKQVHPGQPVRATLADGTVDLTVDLAID